MRNSLQTNRADRYGSSLFDGRDRAGTRRPCMWVEPYRKTLRVADREAKLICYERLSVAGVLCFPRRAAFASERLIGANCVRAGELVSKPSAWGGYSAAQEALRGSN